MIAAFEKWELKYLQMHVDLALGNGIERTDKQEKNTIVHSFNRNFSKEQMVIKHTCLCNLTRDGCGFSYCR
jgi:hypothetical protein